MKNIKTFEGFNTLKPEVNEAYTFDFQDWDNTDIAGMRLQGLMKDLIEETLKDINKEVDEEAAGTGVNIADVKKQAVKEIKEMWIRVINDEFKIA